MLKTGETAKHSRWRKEFKELLELVRTIDSFWEGRLLSSIASWIGSKGEFKGVIYTKHLLLSTVTIDEMPIEQLLIHPEYIKIKEIEIDMENEVVCDLGWNIPVFKAKTDKFSILLAVASSPKFIVEKETDLSKKLRLFWLFSRKIENKHTLNHALPVEKKTDLYSYILPSAVPTKFHLVEIHVGKYAEIFFHKLSDNELFWKLNRLSVDRSFKISLSELEEFKPEPISYIFNVNLLENIKLSLIRSFKSICLFKEIIGLRK